MSHAVDMLYDIYNEQHVRAHKEHRCGACHEAIAPGHTYWRVHIVFDGSARTVKRCERCQALHLHLRGISNDWDIWPDEELNCDQSYEEEWGELPPEIAALAFVRPEELQ